MRRCRRCLFGARDAELLGTDGTELPALDNTKASGSGALPRPGGDAASALASIDRACEALAAAELSPPGLRLLAAIQRSAAALRAEVADGPRSPTADSVLDGVEPWPCPPAEEHEEWRALYPEGGRLLRMQVCTAVESGSEEWTMGRFFASDVGIAVEGPEDGFHSGLLRWEDVADIRLGFHSGLLRRGRAGPGEALLSLRPGACRIESLRLGLGGAQNAERLLQTWTLMRRPSADQEESFHSFMMPAEDPAGRDRPAGRGSFASVSSAPGPAAAAALATRSSAAASPASGILRRAPAASPASAHAGPTQGPAAAVALAPPATQTFLAAVDQLPSDAPSGGAEPTLRGHIPGITLAQLTAAFMRNEDWPVARFNTEVLKAKDMRASPWSEGRRVPGSLVRRLQFSFPAPDNTPRMVQRLIGLPEWMDSSMLVRMKTTEDQLTLVMSTCSHNVPYGECSRIEDRLHFTPDAARGGVAVAKWIGLVWVKSLPWALGPAAGFLEKQVHDQAKETWGKFQAHLRACAS